MSMILTNKREMYTVENSTSTVRLNGDATIDADKNIVSFSGMFIDAVSGESAGSFNYNENSDKMNISYSGITISTRQNCEDILESTIAAIKVEVNK